MATDFHDTVTTPLPQPGAGPQMRMVEVALIEESTTNPRKHFDATKLQELADSIAATGVHQPILLRPLPGHRVPDTWGFRRKDAPLPAYELVAGARRLRACRLAKVAEIPAMIRELTDEQALEIQVIENLQREDVTELEEAEGYEVLMRTGNINADQVAAKIGKSRSYVYARLKILDLHTNAREALRSGDIDFSKALLIARIPDEALQLKALRYCSERNYLGEPRGQRDCAQHVQQNYMLKLSGAPFKITDAGLVPKAGSCKECPKRTGANPDLFQDVGSADVCTDPPCFHAKEEAHATAMKREALARGQQIIEGREAKTLMPNSWSTEVKGYLRLDDKADSPTDKPLRKLIGKVMEQHGIQPTLVANPHKGGQLVAVLTPDQVEGLLKAADNTEAAAKIEEQAQQDARYAKQRSDADAKQAYETQWRWDVLTAAWKEITSPEFSGAVPTDEVLRLLATNMARAYNQDRAKRLCKLLDLGKVAPQAGLLQYIADTETPSDVLQLLVMFNDVEYRHWLGKDDNEGLMLVASQYGVHIDAVKAKTKANQRAAAKAQATPAKSEAPKGSSPHDPAAQASAVRGGGKAKKKGPAAPAGGEAPKTSAAHASAQIAEALAALKEDHDQAPAAQGNEAPPVPDGQAAGGVAPSNNGSAQSTSVALPMVADASQAGATDSRLAPGGNGSADVSDGAAAKPVAIGVGVRVRINSTATGKTQKPWIDYEGVVAAKAGDRAWEVDIERSKRSAPKRVMFDVSELEVLA
ncbi:hypothetical protein BA022_08135 [Diaphorobacter nitroreducens]|nr:ParB/RepB/Spo0J family partition protein [Diaphorobacter nitroreducens]ASI68528.1 hypothetical protein BA022_08135 [Diaphorobacter nitroreducens]